MATLRWPIRCYRARANAGDAEVAVGDRANDIDAVHGDDRVGDGQLRHINGGGDVSGYSESKMILRGVAIPLHADGATVQ